MADIDTGGGKKVSTKVDMTPMVDLAFLLVTFFMLTTTFNKPQTMEVNMPDKTEDNKTMKVAESRTTTLVLAENDKVYYYTGTENPEVKLTNFSESGLRKVLRDKVKTVKDPIVIIKAKKESRYKNMVDVIDEMAITGVKIYALVDITPADLELLEKAPY
jgi:biopolymer transport protein ExbD